jgi:hypothetical protein
MGDATTNVPGGAGSGRGSKLGIRLLGAGVAAVAFLGAASVINPTDSDATIGPQPGLTDRTLVPEPGAETLQGPSDSSTQRQAGESADDGARERVVSELALGTLTSRHYIVEVIAATPEAVYTLRTREGDLLLEHATAEELAWYDPALDPTQSVAGQGGDDEDDALWGEALMEVDIPLDEW